MTWYYQISSDSSEVEVWDHTQDPATDSPILTVANPDAPRLTRDARGIPIEPDVPGDILDALISRGTVDLYALRVITEALTGAGFEEID
jgi:hypothetical protein